MPISLESLSSRIAEGALLSDGCGSAPDRDLALDARDSDRAFEATWAAAFERIEEAWAAISPDDRRRDLVEGLRREAFRAVDLASDRHEIASYVSDDIDLIARAAALGLWDPLLEWLWSAYERGRFPTPPLPAG